MRQTKVVRRVVSFFAMVFDPFFHWLENTIIPRNPAAPGFLELVPFLC